MKEEKREELEKEKAAGAGKDVNKESPDKQDVITDTEGSEKHVTQNKEETQDKQQNQDVQEIQNQHEEHEQHQKQDQQGEQIIQDRQEKKQESEQKDPENEPLDEHKTEQQAEQTEAVTPGSEDHIESEDHIKSEEKDKTEDDSTQDNITEEIHDEDSGNSGNAETHQADGEASNSEPVQPAHLESADQPAGESQSVDTDSDLPKKKGRIWKKILIGFGCFVVLCILGVYIGGAVYFQDKFFINTKINGMDVSRQTVEMVDNTIANNIHKYTITLLERGKKKEKITADQIGYHYVSGGEVQGFKDQQNPYTWPRALWENYRYKFESSTTFDEKKLTQTLKALDCMNEKNVVAPKDAFLKFGETTYEIEPEVEGNTVNYEKLAALVTNLIEHGEKKASLEKNDCYVQPAVRQDNEPLNQLMNNLNQYCRTSITYVFGEKREVLDGKTIKDWVTYDEAGTVNFDEEQVRNYVNMLADQYDTYDRPREFKTNDGSMVTVKGGSYGWMIDQEQEIVDLTKLIQLGAVQERTPAFAQTAVSFENSDLGQDYIEIDLTRQHLWMYIGGQVAVSSDFVSGSMVKAGCATPGGTYTLYYKKSPDVLRSDKPGDSYATPVTYWMPFNGGIGLHDANWRGSFGGNIYQYNGSHGCINLPTDAARQIYEQIYKGFPIICYYR